MKSAGTNTTRSRVCWSARLATPNRNCTRRKPECVNCFRHKKVWNRLLSGVEKLRHPCHYPNRWTRGNGKHPAGLPPSSILEGDWIQATGGKLVAFFAGKLRYSERLSPLQKLVEFLFRIVDQVPDHIFCVPQEGYKVGLIPAAFRHSGGEPAEKPQPVHSL